MLHCCANSMPANEAGALAALRNLGPASARLLARVGIRDRAALQAAGSVAVFADLRAAGHRPSLNLLWALEGALSNQPWQQVAQERRAALLAALAALEAGNARRAAYNRRP